jgi:hypothetical protein
VLDSCVLDRCSVTPMPDLTKRLDTSQELKSDRISPAATVAVVKVMMAAKRQVIHR